MTVWKSSPEMNSGVVLGPRNDCWKIQQSTCECFLWLYRNPQSLIPQFSPILTSTHSKFSLLQARCHCDRGYIDTISLVLHDIANRIHSNLKIGS